MRSDELFADRANRYLRDALRNAARQDFNTEAERVPRSATEAVCLNHCRRGTRPPWPSFCLRVEIRHYGANATKNRHPRERVANAGTQAAWVPCFRGDDGAVCGECGPGGVCYIMLLKSCLLASRTAGSGDAPQPHRQRAAEFSHASVTKVRRIPHPAAVSYRIGPDWSSARQPNDQPASHPVADPDAANVTLSYLLRNNGIVTAPPQRLRDCRMKTGIISPASRCGCFLLQRREDREPLQKMRMP